MKKIPYGLSDFKRIKDENFYFIDKTKFILDIEKANNYLMFLRPRRFGKSLFIAILEAYYDTGFKDEFNSIFRDTYILNHKTKEASSYAILRFDFSIVDPNDVENSFVNHLLFKLNLFIDKYNISASKNNNPNVLLDNIFNYVLQHNIKLYILIDEYDNFSNKILLDNQDNYNKIISNKDSMFKQFFTTLKGGTSGNNAPIKRMFITGVTPMTSYDVTSGFNIGSNISLNKNFNCMIGVTQVEIEDVFKHYNIPTKYLELCKEWYNNYSFSPNAKEKIYNTDMILYFIDKYLVDDEPPRELIDINVRSDYSTLRSIIYTNKKLNGNFESLKKLIVGDSIHTDSLSQDFSALNISKEENFKSLLFYLGLVTICDSGLRLTLKIPNETIKRIDIDFLKDSLEMESIFNPKITNISDYIAEFAIKGDIEVFKYLASEIKEATSLRDYIQNELSIKSMYLAYLSLTPYFVVKSELELNKGFADIFIKPLNSHVKYIGLIELKYIKREDKNYKKQIPELIKKATIQLEQYEKDELVATYKKDGLKLQKVILIFWGWELVECIKLDYK